MVKKSVKSSKNFNVSNRLSYTIIGFVALVLMAAGVYSLTPGVAPNPGHLISELAPPSPCVDGEFLKFNTAGGGSWSCASPTAGMDDDKDGAIDTVFGGQDCNDLDNKIYPSTPYLTTSSTDLDCSGGSSIVITTYQVTPTSLSSTECGCHEGVYKYLTLYPSGTDTTVPSCTSISKTSGTLCRDACVAAGLPEPVYEEKCALTSYRR